MTADEPASKIVAYASEFIRAYTEFFDRYSSYFLNRRTAAARPGWVEVIGGALIQQLPTIVCGSTSVCGPPVTVARPWLKRGLPSSK
jgi:hypothetical protein